MKNRVLTIIFIFIFGFVKSQNLSNIETSDIDNFWFAFDKLNLTTSKVDSIKIIQVEYIDKATAHFKEFIKLRNLRAEEYVNLIGKYPKFWTSIRKETEDVKNRTNEIEKGFVIFENNFPNFKRPNVCFAIGCLRTGGTISENLILIRTEIASSTSSTEKSELSHWLKSVIGTTGDIIAMISHETIHTQQKKGTLKDLVDFTLNEGVADFLSEKITNTKINKKIYKYGNENDCELRNEFKKDYKQNKTDISKWLFNGNSTLNRPADLGYYIGYKIAEEHYNKFENKNKAILELLDRKNYSKIYRKSNYIKKSCS